MSRVGVRRAPDRIASSRVLSLSQTPSGRSCLVRAGDSSVGRPSGGCRDWSGDACGPEGWPERRHSESNRALRRGVRKVVSAATPLGARSGDGARRLRWSRARSPGVGSDPVDRIAIAQEVSRSGVLGKGLNDLLGCPLGARALGSADRIGAGHRGRDSSIPRMEGVGDPATSHRFRSIGCSRDGGLRSGG